MLGNVWLTLSVGLSHQDFIEAVLEGKDGQNQKCSHWKTQCWWWILFHRSTGITVFYVLNKKLKTNERLIHLVYRKMTNDTKYTIY